jgi:transposase
MIPWAEPYARMTYRFEYAMLVFCQIMTQKAAAKLLHIPTSTLSDLLHQSITRLRNGHRIRGLKTIGVDEISYSKGRKFATIVYDLDKSCVVWIGKGKARETIDLFFKGQLSNYQKIQIKLASCDMSEAYMDAIKHHCHNAKLVLDRFHIVKAINGAVDEVRKEQWRQAKTPDRKVLKGYVGSFSRKRLTILKRIALPSRRFKRDIAGFIGHGFSRINSSTFGILGLKKPRKVS